jgi:diguanylate cyclase (GGDEF)-like protein
MVTGADDDEAARAKAMDLGATDFINKKAASAELLPRARAHAKYQRMTRQLQAQATLDALTGLANETGLLARLEQDLFYARRHGQELALMRVDIDGLAERFQARGEKFVEHVVVHVADLIRTRIRKEDTAGRIGLGSFAISAPGGSLAGVEAEAASLRRQAGMYALEIDGQTVAVALTTAVVSAEDAWTGAQDALERCQKVLDRRRHEAVLAAQAVLKKPQPAKPAPAPAPVTARKPEPAPAQKAPVRQPQRVEPARAPPAPARASNVTKQKKLPGRLLASLRSMGARVLRFFKNLSGQ